MAGAVDWGDVAVLVVVFRDAEFCFEMVFDFVKGFALDKGD